MNLGIVNNLLSKCKKWSHGLLSDHLAVVIFKSELENNKCQCLLNVIVQKLFEKEVFFSCHGRRFKEIL